MKAYEDLRLKVKPLRNRIQIEICKDKICSILEISAASHPKHFIRCIASTLQVNHLQHLYAWLYGALWAGIFRHKASTFSAPYRDAGERVSPVPLSDDLGQ